MIFYDAKQENIPLADADFTEELPNIMLNHKSDGWDWKKAGIRYHNNHWKA